jgi:parallel beta-helix repeat protein
MRQPALASLFLLVLLSASVSVFFSSFGSAEDAAVGVSIQADGTVYGTSSIQRNGDVYTFVGNVSGPLHVKKDNIVIDGAGYTLVGGNGRGIVLADRHGVTLKNAQVTLDGGYIIDVENAADCALIGNTLIGNQQFGPIGVNFLHSRGITVKDNTIVNSWRALSLEWSSGHTITGNIFVDGIVGIEIWSTTGCVFRNNSMINSDFSIRVYPTYQYDNDLDSSNTVDGKPIYYWINAKGATVPSDAAYIVLVGCANIIIENASPQGIALISTSSSTISRVEMTGRGDGITLLDCSGISILDSILRDHAIGVYLEDCSNNTISGNEISNHTTRGMSIGNANNNLISGNIFADNSYAIAPFQDEVGTGNIIASNNFAKNDYTITVRGSMEVVGNIFEDNNQAILLSGGSGSTITQNTFTNNKNALYISAASNNNIYLNNFLSNDRQVTDAGMSSSQVSTQSAKTSSNSIGFVQLVATHVSGVNFFPPPPPSTNHWDNGAKGNYWRDYNGSDANGDGIGDTVYYLYENNQDNYPLMDPVAVSEVLSAPSEVPPATAEPPTLTPAPASHPPENTTLPDDTQVTEGTAAVKLQIEYVVAAILVAVAGIAVAWACLFLKRQKSVAVTKASET